MLSKNTLNFVKMANHVSKRTFVNKARIHFNESNKSSNIFYKSNNILNKRSPFPPYSTAQHFCEDAKKREEFVTLHLRLPSGVTTTTKAKVGHNFLDIVLENNVDVDGFGACEGTLACSTCHIVFNPRDFPKVPSTPCDEELDMLDLAFSLTPTSRLGCQVVVTKEMDGWEIDIPASVDAR